MYAEYTCKKQIMSDRTNPVLVDIKTSDMDDTSLSSSSTSSLAGGQHTSFVHEQRAIYASYQLHYQQQHDLDSLPADLLPDAGAQPTAECDAQHHVVEVEPYRPLYVKKANRTKKSRFVASAARKMVCGERSALLEQFEQQLQQEAQLTKSCVVPKASGHRPKGASEFSDNTSSSSSSKPVNWLFVMFVLSYVGYLILGSIAFGQLEGNHELDERQTFRQVRQRFLLKYSGVAGNKYGSKAKDNTDQMVN